MITGRLTIGIGLLCAVLCGCIENGALEIYLKKSPLVEEDPLDPRLVTHLRISVSGPGFEPIEQTAEFHVGGTTIVPDIPNGEHRVITVEGLAGEDGLVLSRGRSLPFSITSAVNRIDLFIARIGRFSLTPDQLSTARFAHSSAITMDGELYWIGGAVDGTIENPLHPLSSIEIYDPTSGQIRTEDCTRPGSPLCLNQARAAATAVASAHGIWIIGGSGPEGPLSEMAHLNPKTGAVSSTSRQTGQRMDAAHVQLQKSSLIAGGRSATGTAVDIAERISPDGQLAPLRLPAPRWAMAAARSSQFGLFFGGFDEQGSITASLFLYDENTHRFFESPTTALPRAWASAVTLSDERVLVIGGMDDTGEALAQVDLFDPALGELCPIGEMARARWLATAVRLPDGRVLVGGGLIQPDQPTAEAEILDPRFVKLQPGCRRIGELSLFQEWDMAIARYGASAHLLPNKTVVITGGLNGQGQPNNQVEVYVP